MTNKTSIAGDGTVTTITQIDDFTGNRYKVVFFGFNDDSIEIRKGDRDVQIRQINDMTGRVESVFLTHDEFASL